jgi:hypothetical protein
MSKIQEFIKHIPEQPPELITECLGLEVRRKEEIQQSTVKLAARGIIGSISFAKYGKLPYRLKLPKEEYALRLLPQVPVERATVIVCFEGFPYARTISPDSANFIAGALAFSSARGSILTEQMKKEIICYADRWGDSTNTRRILETYTPDKSQEEILLKACERTEYFEVFGELLDSDKTFLMDKAIRLLEKYPQNKVLNNTLTRFVMRFPELRYFNQTLGGTPPTWF